jgi:hypothetical protein
MDEEYYDNPNGAQAGSAREPLWMEKLRRRTLGDVRIHDSRQAGELARRLGARAFTIGRDIYAQPELVNPISPQRAASSAALLAHEMTHVAEQTGLAPQDAHQAMPLLNPPAVSSPPSPASSSGVAVQRQTVQRATEGETRSEARAEQAEAEAMREAAARKKKQQPPPDPQVVADHVYDMMVRDLIRDQERGAYA